MENIFSQRVMKSLSLLNNIGSSIEGEGQLDTPQNIASKINLFVDSLNDISESGNEMSELSLQDIPLDLFKCIQGAADDTGRNPNHFQLQLFEETEKRAVEVAQRAQYLKDMHTKLKRVGSEL